MIVQDLSFPSPLQNLQYDDDLLRSADRDGGPEVLRFWEASSVFVVLGRTGVENEEVSAAHTQEDGVPVLRRSSGGGTVVQGPGCMNFSLILSKELRPDLHSIARSYRVILDQVLKALGLLGIEGEFRPVCDLVLARSERKFSGNAQRRGRAHVLHHGTILYDFNLALIARYLKMPLTMPGYRRARPHLDFVTNIPVRGEDCKGALKQVFGAF